MIARFSLVKPEDMEATITITMPLKNWMALSEQLPAAWPSLQLMGVITDAVLQARRVFFAESDKTDNAALSGPHE